MTVAEEQKRLNQEIATELDKYQVMLEYGRMFLDRDKAIRDSYRWLSFAKAGCFTSAVLDIIVSIVSAIFASEHFAKYLPIMLGVFALAVLLYVIMLFVHREGIGNLIGKKDKAEFEKLMDELQSYLHDLGEWLKDVDSHIKQNKTVIDRIDKDLAIAKSKQADKVNKISNIQGILDMTMNSEARNLAELRLQPYKQYIYDNA